MGKNYADIWGDTVDLKHLFMAMVIGITISMACYLAGLKFLQASYPKLAANLAAGYALLGGIGGSLIAAILSAKLFKPKRTLNQAEFTAEDRDAVLEELQVDRAREAEELKTISPEIATEMKELKLYDIFAGSNAVKREGA